MNIAAQDGDVEAVTRLLDAGFDINTQWDMFKASALMKAASRGRIDVVRLLLARGANPRLTDWKGRTAREWAEEGGHTEIARILGQAEGRPAAPAAPSLPTGAEQAPPALTLPATGAAPRDGRWRGTIQGITNGGGQYVEFHVRGGRIVVSTFHIDYHCGPEYSYRERMSFGFEQAVAVSQGRFTATRRSGPTEIRAVGRFPSPTSAEGTFLMETNPRCTTRLARWTAQRVGG